MVKKKDSREGKLRVLAAADLHGDKSLARKLAKRAKKAEVDLVILAGDLHGAVEGIDVVEPFKKENQKVVFVPGNWDFDVEIEDVKKKHGVKNLDEHYLTYNEVGIAGIGNPNFELHFDESDAFRKIKKDFDRMKHKRKILVSHLHAAGTRADYFGFPGSDALRKSIEKFGPDVFVSAHIHEAEGIEEKLGKTKVFHVGRRGKIFEV